MTKVYKSVPNHDFIEKINNFGDFWRLMCTLAVIKMFYQLYFEGFECSNI